MTRMNRRMAERVNPILPWVITMLFCGTALDAEAAIVIQRQKKPTLKYPLGSTQTSRVLLPETRGS